MNIKLAIQMFLDYLLIERGLAKNTFDSYKTDLIEFTGFLQKTYKTKMNNVKNIDKKTILDYYILLDKKEFSKATLQRRYSSLNQFFKFLIKRDILQENPMLTMRRQKKEFVLPKYLTEEEIDRLLAVNKQFETLKSLRNRLILELLYSTGMRVSELCSLPVKSVIFPFEKNDDDGYDYKFITIRGKGGKERIVPIRARVLSLLKEYISLTFKKGQKYLFPSNDKDGYITRRTIVNIIKTSAMLSGIDANKVSPHKIRHSFATHLLQKGLDIREIQELLGHSSIDTTAIYAKIATQNSKEVLEKYHPCSNLNLSKKKQ